jgi:hypothetical protein
VNVALLVAGFAVVGFVMLDVLWTTTAPNGAGPLTRRLSRGVWVAALWVHRRAPGRGLLSALGPALLFVAVVTWAVGLWAGWLLVYSADPGAVTDPSTGEVAGLASRTYFVGYVLWTLGAGPYLPQGGGWEVLTSVATFNGFAVVTLSITYLLEVLQAVTAKRQLAASIENIGRTPVEFVVRSWDGSGFKGLDQHLPRLATEVEDHAQRRLAYPVLHYFYSAQVRTAEAPSVAVLSDALVLLAEGVAEDARPAPAVTGPAQRAVDGYLGVLDAVGHGGAAPPPPDLDAVAAAGVPTVGAGAFARAVDQDRERRARLAAAVHDAGRTWDDVAGDDRTAE